MGYLDMLGSRWVMPRWADDPVRVQEGEDDGGYGKSDGRRRGWGGANK